MRCTDFPGFRGRVQISIIAAFKLLHPRIAESKCRAGIPTGKDQQGEIMAMSTIVRVTTPGVRRDAAGWVWRAGWLYWLIVVCAMFTRSAWSANMTPIVVTGFNRDVVVEKTSGPPPFSTALEYNPGEGTAYYQTGLTGKNHGLPPSGLFASALADGTTFQLQAYTGPNALVLSSETGLTSGTLTLPTPLVYKRIAILANSASGGSGSATLTIRFTDGTTYATTYVAQDWFNTAGNIALQGGERITLSSGAVSGAPTNPRFYQTTLALGNLLPNNKPIVSLTFSKATGASATAVYAVSGEVVIQSPAIITTQPVNQTVGEAGTTSFSVGATGLPAPALQWYRNGSLVNRATNAVFTITSAAFVDNGSPVFVTATNLANGVGYNVTSAVVTLTVIPDTTPPRLVGAQSLGLSNVLAWFSKRLTAATATNPANYVLSGPTGTLLVGDATLDSTQTNVLLGVSQMDDAVLYRLTVNGLRDQTATGNLIITNSATNFIAHTYAALDVGGPPLAGGAVELTNGWQVAGSGDIGGNSDQLQLSSRLLAGDFDVAVRLASMTDSDAWAKAGLMARESLAANSRFAATFATPSMNGDFFEYRDPTAGNAVSAGSFPANYPNTWLRLRRAGNVFSGYGSYDGQNWTRLGQATITMASEVYFGLAVGSRAANQAAVAQFVDITAVGSNAVVNVITNPRDQPGPSSRKSPLAISEIMYRPPPRPDGLNLQYLELYNSNPWFHDVSGYRLVGGNLGYTFPAGTIIPGGGYLVVASAPADLQTAYGITNVMGPYSGSLKPSDVLELHDEQDAVLLSVPYANTPPWPVAANGAGHSLVLAYPTYGEGDPRAWDSSDLVGGSPGQMEAFRAVPLRDVMINEWLAHVESPAGGQYVELYNHSTQTNDLSGCILTDEAAANKFVIPDGTLIGPGGFAVFGSAQLGFALNGAGGVIYLWPADRSRVLDVVQYEAQADGVAEGRWPDGAVNIQPLQVPTPGTNNSDVLVRDVVLNELMYDPISGKDDDQYIELYNKGTNAIPLGGWQFNSGVTFSFPSNSVLAPHGYLVVARNLTNLWTKYPNLNSGNTVGNFSGRLSHNGERLALAMPQILSAADGRGGRTNSTIYVVEDEVTWGTGGRWGQWAKGGGSSLELIDPRGNHRLAANWGDSDETHKSQWTTIEATGVLDNGVNYDPSIDYAQLGLLDVGECLVDNVTVLGAEGTNLVMNSDFESAGTNNWTMQGCHVRSNWELKGYASGHSLRVRCSDRLWTGVNSCQAALWPNSLIGGQSATLRFQARWLRGWPEVLLRLNGNWLEATGTLPVPANLGTPGLPNSIGLGNAGPAIYEVAHVPPVPPPQQPLLVTARAQDADGVASLVLNYRVDPATTYESIPMTDDGNGGDAVAGDGLYTATIPAQPGGAIVAFNVAAADRQGAGTRFPALVDDNAPVRECVVLFGDNNPTGSFGAYHLWLTQANVTRWSSLSDLSNEPMDATMVNGNRIIYNAQGRFAGSPYHQTFDAPNGTLCHYKWMFPEDDKFLGATSFNKIHQPGNAPGDDFSLQREQIANSLLRALGVPWLNRRYVVVLVNGNRRGALMEDTQCPDADMIKERFPNDPDGFLYKMAGWIEFAPVAQGIGIPFANQSWCDVLPYTTTGNVKKPARYRYNWLIRRTPDSANNFTNIFSLVDAANAYGSPNYVANLESLANMENWLRLFAANHAAGNGDSYGAQNGQNVYVYVGTLGTKFSLLAWDFNMVFGSAYAWAPGQNLFFVNPQDAATANLLVQPEFRRMYWRALQELVTGPLTPGNSTPLALAKYNAFVANGLSVENPQGNILPWMGAAHDSIAAQLALEDAAAFTVNFLPTRSNDVAYLSGQAPVLVKTILVNGTQYPLTWTTTTNWTVAVPLAAGTNHFSILPVDMHGQPITGMSNSATVVYKGLPPAPGGQVVISELQPRPAVAGAQYVELFNNSLTNTFDLSGWSLPALGYTFPAGSLLGPRGYLVLAQDAVVFANVYGATLPVFDNFLQPLSAGGEHLVLLGTATNGTAAPVIAEVQYDAAAPWPAAGSVPAPALALIDPQRDNWRVGNWTNANPSPGQISQALENLPVFPSLWINEVQADNLTGITNGLGERTAWLELYNPGSNAVPLTGLFLANNYSNLTQWAFPPGAVINPGQFLVIFADGQGSLSTTAELHTSFLLPGGSGSVALSRTYQGQTQVIDYLNYTNLGVNHSFGSVPDGQIFNRQEFNLTTPGAANNPAPIPLTVVINEWMASNQHTLGDPLDSNKADDWFELYNYGPTPANLAGYYLTAALTTPFMFQIPAGYVIPPGGFLLVWADKKNTAGSADLHVNFKLSKVGASIGLFRADGQVVDYVTFSAQASDISQGRFPDGGPNWYFMNTPTPGRADIIPNTAPVLPPMADQVMAVGQTLIWLAEGVDLDQPAQQLTYSLGGGAPAGALIDPVTGALVWTATNGPETVSFTVVVTDNGTPNLSASQTFAVHVVPVPELTVQALADGQLRYSWGGTAGQRFQLEYTTDLSANEWAALGSSVVATGNSVTVENSVPDASASVFYRLRVLPPGGN